MLAINLLMLVFSALLLGIGGYLFTHQQKDFLIFHPTSNRLLGAVIRNFGIIFVVTGIIAIVTVVTQSTLLICGALIIGCVAVTAFYLCIGKFIPK